MARKRISKSTLSMFLRTKCDRELYLSLHEDSELDANGMPVPLQARPGIGVLQTAGRDFEDERNDQLIQSFGSLDMYQPDKGGANKPVKAPLASLLGKVTALPSILLQGKFEPSAFQNAVMANIGLQPAQVAQVPRIAGLIPDIIVVRQATLDDEEVGADGCRRPIDPTEIRAFAGKVAADAGLTVSTRDLARFPPTPFDETMIAKVEGAARGLGMPVRRMISGAGHDAQMMAQLCPTAMIFVPSIGGLSHIPKEFSEDADLVAGANELLQVVLDVANT